MRRAWMVSLMVLTAGCEKGVTPQEEEPGRPTWAVDVLSGAPTDAPTLRGFSGATACAALEQHIEDRAVRQMRVSLESSRFEALRWWDSSHRLQPGGFGGSVDAGASVSGGGAGGGAGSFAAPGGPTAYTTTTTQYATVDEADFVKNDGTRLFVLSGRTLHTVSTWPASTLARKGSLAIEGRPREMFLDGERLVVFSTVFDPRLGELPSWCASGSSRYCEQWYPNGTVVSWVDVSDLANPTLLSTSRVPGPYFTARRVGSTVRLVTTSPTWEAPLVDTWLPWREQRAAASKAELSAMYDALEARNVTTLRARTLAEWLPAAVRGSPPGETAVPIDCASVLVPTASARLGFASVVTLDTHDPAQLSRQLVLSSVNEVSMSEDMLIVAQRHWWWSEPWTTSAAHDAVTYLYGFSTHAKAGVDFVGAAKVQGLPVDQFALDESKGIVRVALTATTTVTSPSWSTSRTNRVLTLAPDGRGHLVELGRTEDVAPGETIMSARFVGDTAYVVTFRQTDPFYVVDLTDPRAPSVVGELKIPGFSSYLHPMDATHVLAVGTYIPAQPSSWSERGLQVAIFDVSDKTHPVQQHQLTVGKGSSWSEAQWDHKAFTFFAQRGLLALPFFDWQYTAGPGGSYGTWSYTSDLRVFHVDAATGIRPLGAVDVRDLLDRQSCGNGYGYGCWGWYWYPMVRRSVMADDFVYAITSGGVRVANVKELATPLATVDFPLSQ